MVHDFKKFPELTNSQMDFYYFQSPHKQIFESFRAKVIKVTDGDTIRVLWEGRDFDFPIRILDINAPEMNEEGGKESQSWLEGQIIGEEVDVIVDPDRRVEKWGRLLAKVISRGMDVGEMAIMLGHATTFTERNRDKLPNLNKIMDIKQWL
jgi:endonuclease YncB( thermonuclease family)